MSTLGTAPGTNLSDIPLNAGTSSAIIILTPDNKTTIPTVKLAPNSKVKTTQLALPAASCIASFPANKHPPPNTIVINKQVTTVESLNNLVTEENFPVALVSSSSSSKSFGFFSSYLPNNIPILELITAAIPEICPNVKLLPAKALEYLYVQAGITVQ